MADINAILASDNDEVVYAKRLYSDLFDNSDIAFTVVSHDFVIKCGRRPEQSIYHLPSNARIDALQQDAVSIFASADNNAIKVAKLWIRGQDIYFRRCEDGRLFEYTTNYCRRKGREIYISHGLYFEMRRTFDEDIIVKLRHGNATLLTLDDSGLIAFPIAPKSTIIITCDGLTYYD